MDGIGQFCVSGSWPAEVVAKLLALPSAQNGSAPQVASKPGNARKHLGLLVLSWVRLKRGGGIVPVDGSTV